MSCFFIEDEKPKITIVYVYPLDGNQGFASKAAEFVASYQKHPPGLDHNTVVVCNGNPANPSSKALFDPLPNVSFIDHDNSGWDIGAFQLAARTQPCDLMVFFGSHAYFRKAGWLTRMVEARKKKGDTLFGCTGNQGDMRCSVYPHVRTTGFWCSPVLMAKYPVSVTQAGTGGERYQAEHGANCLTSWIIAQGLQPWIVGWNAIIPVQSCDSMIGGFHNNLQENLLVGDRLTAPPYWPHP